MLINPSKPSPTSFAKSTLPGPLFKVFIRFPTANVAAVALSEIPAKVLSASSLNVSPLLSLFANAP